MNLNTDLLNGADLAFIGDAYYTLCMREYVLKKGYTKLYVLHNETTKFVSRKGQNLVINTLIDEKLLTNAELELFKRGRNYDYKDKTSEYVNASGFEALIGYLYLNNEKDRLNEIINKSINIIENR